MPRHRFSRAAYRCLLCAYPREFRERFADDLQADFVEMIEARGRAHAWRRVVADLFAAVPLTAADAAAERDRTARIAGPINPNGESKMRSLLYDLRQALRSLTKARGNAGGRGPIRSVPAGLSRPRRAAAAVLPARRAAGVDPMISLRIE
jgi:hypothetical protein